MNVKYSMKKISVLVRMSMITGSQKAAYIETTFLRLSLAPQCYPGKQVHIC